MYAEWVDIPLSQLPVPLDSAADEPERMSEQRQSKPRPRRTILRLLGHEEQPKCEGSEDQVQYEHDGGLEAFG